MLIGSIGCVVSLIFLCALTASFLDTDNTAGLRAAVFFVFFVSDPGAALAISHLVNACVTNPLTNSTYFGGASSSTQPSTSTFPRFSPTIFGPTASHWVCLLSISQVK